MEQERDIAIKITGLKKKYRLGTIGGGTLRGDIQSWWAKVRKKEDPNSKIGAKTYGKNETFMALDGIDLTVYKGERLGIIGHNGAGKSTLLKLLSRVTGPTEGEICLDGRISSMLEVGTGFNGELTGRENIYLNGAILGMTKAEVDSKIEKIIDFSEVRQFIDTPVKRYSSGMYVKLAFAVAAHLDSEILIMDEVLAVGDMAFQKKCLDKMNQVSQDEGRTILYVSHNMNTIRQLCDRCIVMDHGKIIFNGDVEKAIEIYFKNVMTENTSIDYRVNTNFRRLGNAKIKLLSAQFMGKDKIVFSKDEKLHIKLKWENLQKIRDLCLRIEILTTDRLPLASSVYFNFYNGEKNEQGEIEFYLSIPGIVAGKYTMNYTFFQKTEDGRHFNVECAYGLYFIVVESENFRWQSRYFGNFMLPAIEEVK